MPSGPERAQDERAARASSPPIERREFGVEHRFADMRTPEQFRERVPVQDYETLRGYIERQRCTGARRAHGGTAAVLCADERFHRQAQIHSGLAHRRSASIAPSRRCSRTCSIARARRRFRARRWASWARRSRAGSIPATTSARSPDICTSRCPRGAIAVRRAAGGVGDRRLRSEVPGDPAARARRARHHLSRFAESLHVSAAARHPERSARRAGALARNRDRCPSSMRSTRTPRDRGPTPAATRSRACARSCAARRRSTFASLWPGIRLLTTWTGGSCGIALDKLRATLPARDQGDGARVSVDRMSRHDRARSRNTRRFAAASSSFLRVRATGRLGQRPAGVPGPRASSSRTRGTTSLITTAAGLYRYFMNDLVEVTGRYRNTPLLRFVQKGKGVTSLTGEKLYEAQVIQAVQDTARRHGFAPGFFLLVADEESSSYQPLPRNRRCGARRRSSRVAADVDQRLGELNVEYHSKRASGRLAPLTIALAQARRRRGLQGRLRARGPARGTVQAGGPSVSTEICRCRSSRMSSSDVRIDRFEFRELRIPFKVAFRHAAAERTETETVWIEAIATDGVDRKRRVVSQAVRHGRNARHGARVRVAARGRRCDAAVTSVDTLRAWMAEHEDDIDANPAAWCALELARARPARQAAMACRSKRCLSLPPLAGAVPLHRRSRRCVAATRFTRWRSDIAQAGFSDFKVKLSGDRRARPREDGGLQTSGPTIRFGVRADANNLWPTRRRGDRRHCAASATRSSRSKSRSARTSTPSCPASHRR